MPEAIAILLIIAAVVVGVVATVMVAVPVFRGIGWCFRQVGRFIYGEFTDIFRLIGAIILGVVYVPLIILNLLIGRWSASGHYGRALQSEFVSIGSCAYRIVLGHPIRLIGLGGMTEGLERRLPAVVKAAPTSDGTSPRSGQFEGYKIVGSLAGGGSGAKLYIAEPDAVKAAAFAREGLSVGQVVIKTFSLQDGSTLPQIVRESRSLDAAKRLGLILDHDLQPERFYYVMRYVPGENLSLTTKKLHASSPAEGLGNQQLRAALGIACDLVSTLSTYHRGGLWHKDVKPDNIIIDGGPTSRAHLVDFGLVSSLRSAMTLTTHGTEYFRDPEMVRLALKGVKVHEVDGTRFDIYGAGAVLYSMIEDSFPAHGVLSQVTKRCPDSVKWIIRRAMTDYDKRYASSDAMLADLQAVAAAPDPFAVKPVELPSMRGSFMPVSDIPAQPAAAAFDPQPAPTPQPTPSPFAATPGYTPGNWSSDQAARDDRRAPRIRVANWWSGRTEVEPGAADRPKDFAVMVGEIAERSVRQARDAVQAAVAGVQAGMGQRGPVYHSASPPWQPKAGPRAKAVEQLRSARARAAAARDRARARIGMRCSVGTGNGGRKGIALAIVVIFVAMGVVGTRSSRTARRASLGPVAQVSPGNQRLVNKNRQPAVQPVNIDARVLVINDIRRPWSEPVTAQVNELMARLAHAGITTVGEGPNSQAADDAGTIDLVANARLVLDGTQTPVDAPEAPTKFTKWFGDQQPNVDAVIWIARDPESGNAQIHIFPSNTTADKAEAIRTIAMTPPAKTRG